MPEENQDDNDDGENDFYQRQARIGDRSLDQLGTVVHRHHFYAAWQTGLNILETGFHPVDHIERIVAVAHDNDSGNDFSAAIQIAGATSNIGTNYYCPNVFDPNRSSIDGSQHGLFDIVLRLH